MLLVKQVHLEAPSMIPTKLHCQVVNLSRKVVRRYDIKIETETLRPNLVEE